MRKKEIKNDRKEEGRKEKERRKKRKEKTKESKLMLKNISFSCLETLLTCSLISNKEASMKHDCDSVFAVSSRQSHYTMRHKAHTQLAPINHKFKCTQRETIQETTGRCLMQILTLCLKNHLLTLFQSGIICYYGI